MRLTDMIGAVAQYLVAQSQDAAPARPMRTAENDKWLELAQYQADNPILKQRSYANERVVPFNPMDNRSEQKSVIYSPMTNEGKELMRLLTRGKRGGLAGLLGWNDSRDFLQWDMKPRKLSLSTQDPRDAARERAVEVDRLRQVMSRDISGLPSDFDRENYRRGLIALLGMSQYRPDMAPMFEELLGQIPRTPYSGS